MDKELKAYKLYIENKINQINKQLGKTKDTKNIDKQITELTNYHNQTIHNFQHERFIHLIVTFFFAGLFLLSVAVSISFAMFSICGDGVILTNLSLCISLILFITELFYIRHYYILENYTQSLYKYSKTLHEISQKYTIIDSKP